MKSRRRDRGFSALARQLSVVWSALALAAAACEASRSGAAGVGTLPRASDAPPRAPEGPLEPGSTAAEGVRATAPVVVAIVVDQLAAWVAAEVLPHFQESAGFGRLLREGTYVEDVRFAHAVTDTAPGHAALFTGAPPSVTGVVANAVLDPATGAPRAILFDPSMQLTTAAGVQPRPGSSLARVRTETVADRLRAEEPEAVIVSLSIKDRGAIFGGGAKPTATLWFDASSGSFVTSTAFADALPGWALPAASPPIAALEWSPRDVLWLGERARVPDVRAGEGVLPGMSNAFPHPLGSGEQPASVYRFSPFADEGVVDLAIAALGALPMGEKPTLLALSLSANDYIGHVYGPESWEVLDNLSWLDASLARLFAALDERLGRDRYAVVLSADHGTAPLPETDDEARYWCGAAANPFELPCAAGGRLHMEMLLPELEALAVRTVGRPGPWILGVVSPYMYLAPRAAELDAGVREKVLGSLGARLERERGIAETVAVSSIEQPCPGPSDDSLAALVCRSVAAASGDLYLVPERGHFFHVGYTPEGGCNHGTPYLYDRSVPLLIRAPGRVRVGQRLQGPRSFATFARTAASLLGVGAPGSALPASDILR